MPEDRPVASNTYSEAEADDRREKTLKQLLALKSEPQDVVAAKLGGNSGIPGTCEIREHNTYFALARSA